MIDTPFLWSEPFWAMAGLVACLIGFFVMALLLSIWVNEELTPIVSGLIITIPTIYFLVRLVKWAWETPIPWAR